MATVFIGRGEIDGRRLPAVCIVTGVPSAIRLRHRFTWTPPPGELPWEFAILNHGVTVAVRGRHITLDLPIASRKLGYWLRRRVFGAVGLFGFTFVFLLGITNVNELRGAVGTPDYGRIAAAMGVGFAVVAVIGGILRFTGVRPTGITERGVTLTGVHENFAAALDRMRNAENGNAMAAIEAA